MAGGLLQLAAVGSQNQYLTKSQMTFLKLYTGDMQTIQWSLLNKHLMVLMN